MKRIKVCTAPKCAELVPCPIHTRAATRSWSTGRNRQDQHRFRQAVLERDGYRCTRCGHHDPTGKTLQAHHTRPGYEPSAGLTHCTTCHRAVDNNAR